MSVNVAADDTVTNDDTGSKSVGLKVTRKTITDDMISLTKTSYEYTGNQIKPGVSYYGLTSSDVDKSYGPNKNVGKGTVTFTGKGNYQGTVTKTFNIVKANNKITNFTVTGGKVGAEQLYSWKLNCNFGSSNAVVYFSKSPNGSYSTTEPKTAGTYYAKAYIPGTSNYYEVWSDPVKFTIAPKTTPAPTGKVTILNTIANSAKKTNDVIWDKSKVKNATNYEINWRARGASKWASTTVGNTVRGTTSGLTIKGLYEIRVRPMNSAKAGQWSNSVYRYFHTTEKIRLTSKGKGSFTMSWKKNPQATGYQVLFTTNKNGSGAANNINTVGANATSFTKSGLRSGTTYYVQVREIKRVGSITYIGNISCPVAIKVK